MAGGQRDQAQELLRRVKKQHYDARHNCWCYLLGGSVVRYSDDGEPQGTAGQPMLAVFQREHVTNVLCVVTRYFGGILLGAGGLTGPTAKAPGTRWPPRAWRPWACGPRPLHLSLSPAGAGEAGGAGRRRHRGRRGLRGGGGF